MTDRLIGLVRWVEFRFTASDREALHDPAVRWTMSLETPAGEALTADVDEAVLESLSADVG